MWSRRRRGPERELGLNAPRFRPRDLIVEAVLSITGHPGRSLLTAVGTVLGAAAFVSTLGVSSTLNQQVSETFDVRRAVEVVVRPDASATQENSSAAAAVPGWQSADRLTALRGLNGVADAGARVTLAATGVRRGASDVSASADTKIIGADAGAVRVMAPEVTAGRTFDTYHDRPGVRVAMLSRSIATRLGIDRVGVAVFVGDQGFTVIGIFDDVERRPEALSAIIVPFTAANELASHPAADSEPPSRDVIVRTLPGAAQLVGDQAPIALDPVAPKALSSEVPPDPKTLRRQVEASVTRLSLILSVVALAIGTVSIGNAATAGIAARTAEIGLRRAVGAQPHHVFVQLLGETTLLGTIGGLLGTLAGLVVTVAVALANGWTPVVDLGTALLASAGGALAGLLAGLVPALLAVRIQPVAALQR